MYLTWIRTICSPICSPSFWTRLYCYAEAKRACPRSDCTALGHAFFASADPKIPTPRCNFNFLSKRKNVLKKVSATSFSSINEHRTKQVICYGAEQTSFHLFGAMELHLHKRVLSELPLKEKKKKKTRFIVPKLCLSQRTRVRMRMHKFESLWY